MLSRRFFPAAVAIAALSLHAATPHAQTVEDDLRARLLNKELFLRGAWLDDNLKFDAAGNPEHSYKTGPFTIAGVRVDGLTFSGDHLEIQGVRVGLSFDNSGAPHRTVLRASGKRNAPDEPIKIEVEGRGSGDITAAVEKIFAEDVKDLFPGLPPFWQPVAHAWAETGVAHVAKFRHPCAGPVPEPPSSAPETYTSDVLPCADESTVVHVDKTVQKPKLVHYADPRFSDWARRMKFSGNCQIYLVVNKQGEPENIAISRPVGMGLDEEAIAAVLQYRFNPAIKDGQPIAVDLYVEVNFKIF